MLDPVDQIRRGDCGPPESFSRTPWPPTYVWGPFPQQCISASKVNYCGVEWIFVPPSSELELEGPMLHMGDALGPTWLHGKKKPE